jgi:hypothetical protein
MFWRPAQAKLTGLPERVWGLQFIRPPIFRRPALAKLTGVPERVWPALVAHTFVAACTVSPTRHSTWSIKLMYTYWLLSTCCILHSGSKLQSQVTPWRTSLSHWLLSPSEVQILLTSHISAENKNCWKIHGMEIHIYLLNSFVPTFHTSIIVMFIYLIHKSAVTKSIFCDFHQLLIIAKDALIRHARF